MVAVVAAAVVEVQVVEAVEDEGGHRHHRKSAGSTILPMDAGTVIRVLSYMSNEVVRRRRTSHINILLKICCGNKLCDNVMYVGLESERLSAF
jgi:hypothetical protein